MLGGSEELKRRYLTPLAQGVGAFSYGLSEREAGSDAASMTTRATRRRRLDLNGRSRGHQRRGLPVLHRVRGHGPEAGAAPTSRRSSWRSRRGVTFGARSASSASRARPPGLYFDKVRIPADRIIGQPGDRLKIAPDPRPHPGHDRCPGRRHRAGRARRRAGLRQGTQAVRQADRRVPGHPVHARRHGDELEAARQLVYVAAAKSERRDADLTVLRCRGEVLASDVAMQVTTDAVQLLGGTGTPRTSRWSG